MKKIMILFYFFVLTSFNIEETNNDFSISFKGISNRIPKLLTIQIKNNESSDIQLENLVIFISLDNGKGFNGIYNQFRFLDKKLIIKSQKQFKQSILFELLEFTSYGDNKKVILATVKEEMKKSKDLKIFATINDERRLKDPLSSSSSKYSNTIDLSKK